MPKHTLLASIIFISISVWASDIEITDAYVRAVPKNLANSAAFMKIKNNSDATLYLQKAHSSSAKVLELHEHIMQADMMKMQEVSSIEIPAHSTVELKPGGLHVMLLGLTKPLVLNDFINDFTLEFSNNETVHLEHLPIKSVMQAMKH